jgi:hypothetical protein
MKVRIGYPVLARGRLEKSVKERLILIRDSADFEIPEYSRRELVRAARIEGVGRNRAIYGLGEHLYAHLAPANHVANPEYWNRTYFDFHKARKPQIDHPAAALIRQHSAVLRQLRDDHGTQLSSALSPTAVADVVAGRSVGTDLAPRSDFNFKSIDEEAFQHAKNVMRDSVARLMLVDGHLWQQCRAPVVTYEPLIGNVPTRAINSMILEAPVHESLVEILERLHLAQCIISGGDEMHEGEALAREITTSCPGTTEDDHQIRPLNGRLVTEVPELMATDTASLGILHCAISTRGWMALNLSRARGHYDDHTSVPDRLLGNMANATLAEMITLKGLVDGIARAESQGVDDELVEHVRSAMNSELSYGYTRQRDVTQQIVEASIDRWDNRPISVVARARITTLMPS